MWTSFLLHAMVPSTHVWNRLCTTTPSLCAMRMPRHLLLYICTLFCRCRELTVRNIETTMNGQAPVSACDMVVKVVPDLAKVGEILEEVETEEERLVLDMRSLPEEDMQVLPLISLLDNRHSCPILLPKFKNKTSINTVLEKCCLPIGWSIMMTHCLLAIWPVQDWPSYCHKLFLKIIASGISRTVYTHWCLKL